MMQPRFERRQPNTAYSLIEQPRYRAGFDFLRLRADVGEAPAELADWWEDFALGSDDDREALLAAAREAQRQPPKRVPKAKPAAPTAPVAEAEAEAEAAAADTDDGADAEDGDGAEAPAEAGTPARKRRRRRRKPAGERGAAPAADGG